YRSLRPSLVLPKNPNLSLVANLFTNVSYLYNKTALIDADSSQTLSFAQLKTQVSKLAHGLLNLGINKNDVILILSSNNIQYPICFLAATAIGAIVTTANPVYTIAELSRQINDSNPKMVITVPELWNKVKGFNFDLPAVIIGSSNIAGSNSKFTSFETLMEAAGITIFL
ncbi:4-coumarate-CoA ligase-like 7-like, partial [Trifolium medium]|nr:4-coumarate-CoA ligase-like 7-like [Trifolium medium]